jgi:hypothetical protein
MTDIQTQTEDQLASQYDELSLLKQRARLMGVDFSNNIGIEKLRERIQTKLDSNSSHDMTMTGEINPLAGDTEITDKPLSIRERLIRDEMKLVRLRITNMDPKKAGLPGEILTVGNEYIGTVRKFIPYGEVTDDGYHVPHILYTELQDRKFLEIKSVKDKGGQVKVITRWVKEFALEVLPPLTQDEIKRLAVVQAAAGGVSD